MELEAVACSERLVKFYQKTVFQVVNALKTLNIRLAAVFHVRKIIVWILTQELTLVTDMLYIFLPSNSFTCLHTTTTTTTKYYYYYYYYILLLLNTTTKYYYYY
jgi:hypothetical protein